MTFVRKQYCFLTLMPLLPRLRVVYLPYNNQISGCCRVWYFKAHLYLLKITRCIFDLLFFSLLLL